MSDFLTFSVLGLVIGCILAVAALGLVVTYNTSGIFNFAHGAIGMFMAFVYWELHIHHHWPTWLAVLVVLGVLAPLSGVLIERILVRRLAGAPIGVTLVVTLGLLLLLLGLAQDIWDPSVPRPLPKFFGNSYVRVLGVNVTYHQLIVVAVAAAVAGSLRLFFYRTRVGIAMRAVVDDPELTALNAVEPNRVSQLSWALGAMLAALAGVLIAPLINLNAVNLTLLVVNAYAAAMVGRLKSLPGTFVGALILSLSVAYAARYLPQRDFFGGWVNLIRLQEGLPTIFLFLVLLVLPSVRLKSGRTVGGWSPRVPGLRRSLLAAAIFVAASAVVANVLSIPNLITAGDALAAALVMLSLVLLTGWGGQVSICQLTFAGLGAFMVGKVGASPLGMFTAIAVAAGVGALIALPALRLQGLYLALATLAFARFMDVVFFNSPKAFGFGGSLKVDRFHTLGLSFNGERIHFVLLAAVFAVAGVGLLWLRRGRFGRRLAAMGDSEAACATLGIDLTKTKLAVFALSAGLAGLGGALLGGLHTAVTANDFTMLASLGLLLLVTLGGISTVTGAFLGGLFAMGLALIQQHIPSLGHVAYLLPGIGAISLGFNPNGSVGQTVANIEKLRARREPRAAVPAPPKGVDLAGAAG